MSKTVSLRVAAATALRWSVGARFVTQLISWGATLLVIRLLTPEDYGLLAMAMVVISFAVVFNELGTSTLIVRNLALSRNEIGSIQGLVVALNLTLGTITFLAAPLFSAIYGADITAVLRACCLMFLAYSIGIVQEALLMRAMDFRSRAIVETTSQLTGSVVTLLLALLGCGVWALITGMIVGQIVRALGFLRVAPARYPWRLDFQDLRPHINFAVTLAAQRVVHWVPSNVTMMGIGALWGPKLLGLYSVGGNLAFLPLAKVGSVLHQVGFATYARSQERADGIGMALTKGLDFLSFVFFPFCFLGAALAPEAITLVLGDGWLEIIPIVQFLIIVVPFQAMTTQINQAVNAAGDAKTGFTIQIVYAVLGTGCVMAGAMWSIEGAALGWTVALPLVHSVALVLARRSVNLAVRGVLNSYARSFLIGIVAAGTVILARQLGFDANNLFKLAALGVAAGLAGLASMVCLDRKRMVDMIGFARAR